MLNESLNYHCNLKDLKDYSGEGTATQKTQHADNVF